MKIRTGSGQSEKSHPLHALSTYTEGFSLVHADVR